MKQTSTLNNPIANAAIDINAEAKDIFNAWIDPERLSHWMFGPAVRNEKIIGLRSDARKGGRFSFAVERDGKPFNHIGTYLDFQPHTRLVFTWGIKGQSDNTESIVTINIIPRAKGCHVQLTHVMDPKWAEYKDKTEQGWIFLLDKLKALWP